MFRKFAKADVIEVKSASERVRTASLAKFANFNEYRTDDGFVYIRVRAISSRVNKNHDGWPSEELSKSYRSFIGKPAFVDHHNSDPGRARGVIVDAALHVEDLDKTSGFDPYYASAPDNHKPPTWIELLIEVDANTFPKLAKAIVNKDIDSVSMGANVERTKCSHCANVATTPEEYCSHVRSKGAHFTVTDPKTGEKTSKRSYEDCYDIGFFEISFVFDPADETALVNDIRTSKVAEIMDEGAHQQPDLSHPDYAHLLHAAQSAFDSSYTHQGGTSGGVAEGFLAAKRAVEQAGHPQLAFTIANHIKGRHDGLINKAINSAGGDGDVDSMDYSFMDLPSTMWDRGVMNNSVWSSLKQADRQNPEPQSDMTVAPDQVDTLRQDQLCPICGSDMADGVCEVCNYEEPPEGFDNPDLTKAQEVDQQMRQQDAEQAANGQGADAQNSVDPSQAQQLAPQQVGQPGPQQPTASTGKGADSYRVISDKTAATNGGRVNTQERPILPVTRTLSDKPKNPRVLQDSTGPKESNTRKEHMSDQIKKVADGATAEGGADVQADRRVDVEGVGAVAGDPEAGTQHVNVEKAMSQEAGPHTDTWHGNEGDSLGQHAPVTNEDNPSITVTHTRQSDTANDVGGPIGESASGGGSEKGGPTWDTSDAGFPDHDPARVDLFAPLKEEVGERTKTFPKDDFHVGDPVSTENGNEVGGPMGTAIKAPLSSTQVFAHAVKAMKLAETEVAMNIISEEEKFERVAELENTPVSDIDATLAAYDRSRTASAKTQVIAKPVVGSLPSFSKKAHVDPVDTDLASNWNPEDSIWG